MIRARETIDDQAVALEALVWTLGDAERADRLLSLTGLDPADLRARAGHADVLGAVLGFLEGHEPDLIACASALGITPQTLVTVRERLSA